MFVTTGRIRKSNGKKGSSIQSGIETQVMARTAFELTFKSVINVVDFVAHGAHLAPDALAAMPAN